MKRKTPYKHPVGSHTRGGKRISNYTRGKGSKPRQPRKISTPKAGSSRWGITLKFPGGEESYNVSASTLSNAIKAGLNRLQRPVIPDRILWVRL